MIRGTTPTIVYKFPFDVSLIEKFRMYFIQGSTTVLTKTEEDTAMTIIHTSSSDTVSVKLTQAETYEFSANKKLLTESRFLLTDGTVGATKSYEILVNDIGGTEEILAAETE